MEIKPRFCEVKIMPFLLLILTNPTHLKVPLLEKGMYFQLPISDASEFRQANLLKVTESLMASSLVAWLSLTREPCEPLLCSRLDGVQLFKAEVA